MIFRTTDGFHEPVLGEGLGRQTGREIFQSLPVQRVDQDFILSDPLAKPAREVERVPRSPPLFERNFLALAMIALAGLRMYGLM